MKMMRKIRNINWDIKEEQLKYLREHNKEYYSKPENKRKMTEYSKKYYIKIKNTKKYKESKRKSLNRKKELRKQNKLIVLDHYGHKCFCCGENHFELLTIDHINGGGNKHRKELHSGKNDSYNLYKWLIKNNFPKEFRILCFNCNISRGLYGYCPHKNT